MNKESLLIFPARLLGVCVATICLTGGNLFLLQIVAWGWMIGSYSSEDGLASALIDTFGGDRPCALCNAIVETERETAPATSSADTEKLKLLSRESNRFAVIPPSKAISTILFEADPIKTLAWGPPTPPPRRLG